MKKNIILFCSVIVLILGGCSKDESPAPSYKDIDWFTLQDDPNDPLKHLIYEVYKETGIPIFCNDTIGEEQAGLDTLGKPYIRYEILSVNYTLTSNAQTIFYDLEYDIENLKSGVCLMRDTLFPKLPKSFHMRSLLLTKTLSKKEYSWQPPASIVAFQGLNTFVIGGMGEIRQKTSAERNKLAMSALSILIADYVNKNYTDDLASFFLVSTKVAFAGKTSDNVYNIYLPHNIEGANPWETIGFLGCAGDYSSEYGKAFMSYTEIKDLTSFVEAYFIIGDVAFKEKYKNKEYILEKYEILKALIQKIYQ